MKILNFLKNLIGTILSIPGIIITGIGILFIALSYLIKDYSMIKTLIQNYKKSLKK
jgi:hypothetical protein